MTDLFKRIDKALLYPPFLKAVGDLLDDAEKMGSQFWVISGFRTYADQMALWAQGRTRSGIRVTNAMGGQSAHNFGVAVDLCLDGDVLRTGLQPNYKPESYEVLAELAPKHGLVWGGSWKIKDRPHLQIPNYITATQLEPLKYCFEMSGLLSVFEYLSKGTP